MAARRAGSAALNPPYALSPNGPTSRVCPYLDPVASKPEPVEERAQQSRHQCGGVSQDLPIRRALSPSGRGELSVGPRVRKASKRATKPSDSSKDDASTGSFRDWVAHDFEIWQGRVRGADAAIEILSPIAAVALGMMGFAIVLHLSVQHAL